MSLNFTIVQQHFIFSAEGVFYFILITVTK